MNLARKSGGVGKAVSRASIDEIRAPIGGDRTRGPVGLLCIWVLTQHRRVELVSIMQVRPWQFSPTASVAVRAACSQIAARSSGVNGPAGVARGSRQRAQLRQGQVGGQFPPLYQTGAPVAVVVSG